MGMKLFCCCKKKTPPPPPDVYDYVSLGFYNSSGTRIYRVPMSNFTGTFTLSSQAGSPYGEAAITQPDSGNRVWVATTTNQSGTSDGLYFNRFGTSGFISQIDASDVLAPTGDDAGLTGVLHSLEQDSSGNLYVCRAVTDPMASFPDNFRAYLRKYSAAGSMLWEVGPIFDILIDETGRIDDTGLFDVYYMTTHVNAIEYVAPQVNPREIQVRSESVVLTLQNGLDTESPNCGAIEFTTGGAFMRTYTATQSNTTVFSQGAQVAWINDDDSFYATSGYLAGMHKFDPDEVKEWLGNLGPVPGNAFGWPAPDDDLYAIPAYSEGGAFEPPGDKAALRYGVDGVLHEGNQIADDVSASDDFIYPQDPNWRADLHSDITGNVYTLAHVSEEGEETINRNMWKFGVDGELLAYGTWGSGDTGEDFFADKIRHSGNGGWYVISAPKSTNSW